MTDPLLTAALKRRAAEQRKGARLPEKLIRAVKCKGCNATSHVYPGDAPRYWREGFCRVCQGKRKAGTR